MKNKTLPKIILVLFGMIILASSVSAYYTFSLDSVLNPFGNLNIASFYLRYYEFIDAMIYFLLFLSLSQMIYTKVYSTYNDKKSAKMVAVAVGLALAISMIVLEMDTGFKVGDLGVVALVVLLLVLAMLLYNVMLGLFTNEKNNKRVSAALTYLIIYGLIVVPFGTLYDWIQRNTPLLSGVLALAAVAAFILLIIEMIGLFTDGKKKEETPTTVTYPPNPQITTTTPPVLPVSPQRQYPTDLANLINSDYTNLLVELLNRYHAYAQYFNLLIQMHFGATTPPNREPNAAEWTTLLSLRDDTPNGITWALNRVNDLLHAIRGHPGYPLLNATDAGKLQNLIILHGNLNNAITQFEIDARIAYNNRTRPPTIPQP